MFAPWEDLLQTTFEAIRRLWYRTALGGLRGG